jgi:putative transposase
VSRHDGQSSRLDGYDYSRPGAYFITVCTQDRRWRFGVPGRGTVLLNDAGRMVWECWRELPVRFPCVAVDAFVVMPDHVHGILWITGHPTPGVATPTRGVATGAGGHRRKTTVSDVVGAFKSITTVRYIRGVRTNGWAPFDKRLWQDDFYESIVRDERALGAMRRYVADNPRRLT